MSPEANFEIRDPEIRASWKSRTLLGTRAASYRSNLRLEGLIGDTQTFATGSQQGRRAPPDGVLPAERQTTTPRHENFIP